MATPIFESLCGESGLVNQINDTQDQIREVTTAGINAINSVKRFTSDLNNVVDAIENQPGVVTRRLQEDLFNILSKESLANPTGTIAKLLEIRAAYQGAGPALDRILENVEQFIKDPLNTPLNLCEDVPNIVKLGDAVQEFAQPAVVPDKSPEKADKELFTKEVGLSDFEIVPRFPTRSISEAVETAGRFTRQPGPGDANTAAIGQ